MKKKEVKLIFLSNTVTSYQNNFFNELKKIVKIKVIVLSRSHKNYNFSINENFYKFIEDFKNRKKEIKNLINIFNPTHVIFGGYRLNYTNFIKNLIYNKNVKYYYWLERLNKEKKIKLIVLKYILKKILKNSDGIISVGNEAKNFYKKFNKNVINIPYSIKVTKNYKKILYSKKINFLYVGQLIFRKGFDVIYDLVKNNNEYKNFQLNIVGEGSYKKKFLKLSKKFKNVKYYKFQNENSLKRIYSKSDVLIFPSRFDGWGVVALEAMNYKLAIIATKNVGVKEIIPKDNVLIKPSSKDLSKKIEMLLNNSKLIQELGKKNKSSLKNSLCNSQNAANEFIKFIINEK